MKNTEKTSRTSKWLYSAAFLLLGISGGGLIYYSFGGGQVSDFQQQLNHINDVNNLELPDDWKKFSNKELIGIAKNNIKEKNKLDNKLLLREDFDLDTNQRKSLRDILKNIEELKLVEEEFEKLDNAKKQQLKEKIHRNWEKLSRIDFTIDPRKSDRLTKQFQSGQNYWLNNTFSQEKSEVESRLKSFINPFYDRFLTQILSENKEKRAKRVIPEKVSGKKTNDENYHQHVDYIINNPRYREFSSPVGYMKTFEEMEIKWKGFTKFLADNDKGEGTVTLGVTRCSHEEKVRGFPFSEPNSTETFFFCADSPRLIEIELRKELVFNRLGKDNDQWVSTFSKDEKGTKWTLWDVSWETLTETIAHELAHAVIDALRSVYKGSDGKGHGLLHSRYTDQIREMMENSSEYKNFERWWKKKW